MCNMPNFMFSDYETDTFRPWAELPDRIIHSIAIRLTTFRVLAAFGGTCRSWRSVVLSDAVTESLIQHQPLMLLEDPTLSSETVSFIRTTDGKIYTRYVPGIHKLQLVGQSFGHLILAPRPYKYSIHHYGSITLLNIFTGAQMSLCTGNSFYQQACLTAPPTSLDCLLVLVSNMVIQYRNIEGGPWTVREYKEGITNVPQRPGLSHLSSVVAIKDSLYAADFMGKVVELKINPPSSPKEIWYEDGLDPALIREYHGKLVMVGSRQKVYQFNSSTGEWERISINSLFIETRGLNTYILWKPHRKSLVNASS